MKQHTLAHPFTVEGKGLHTGLYLHATFTPAEDNYGIRLCRIDLPDQPTHHAYADYVSATERALYLNTAVGAFPPLSTHFPPFTLWESTIA